MKAVQQARVGITEPCSFNDFVEDEEDHDETQGDQHGRDQMLSWLDPHHCMFLSITRIHANGLKVAHCILLPQPGFSHEQDPTDFFPSNRSSSCDSPGRIKEDRASVSSPRSITKMPPIVTTRPPRPAAANRDQPDMIAAQCAAEAARSRRKR